MNQVQCHCSCCGSSGNTLSLRFCCQHLEKDIRQLESLNVESVQSIYLSSCIRKTQESLLGEGPSSNKRLKDPIFHTPEPDMFNEAGVESLETNDSKYLLSQEDCTLLIVFKRLNHLLLRCFLSWKASWCQRKATSAM